MSNRTETGKMSNLITDMTLHGATPDELQRAIKHAMATIDYEKSAEENDIASLMEKYNQS